MIIVIIISLQLSTMTTTLLLLHTINWNESWKFTTLTSYKLPIQNKYNAIDSTTEKATYSKKKKTRGVTTMVITNNGNPHEVKTIHYTNSTTINNSLHIKFVYSSNNGICCITTTNIMSLSIMLNKQHHQ